MLRRRLTDSSAESSKPGEWGQRSPDQERGRIGHGDLAPEFEQDAREIWKPWKPRAAKTPRQTQRLVLREELLHAQRWTRLHISVRRLPAVGAKPMRLPWRDDHRLAWARQNRL